MVNFLIYEFPHIFEFMLFLYRSVLSACTHTVTIVLSVQSDTSPYYNLSTASYPSTDIQLTQEFLPVGVLAGHL